MRRVLPALLTAAALLPASSAAAAELAVTSSADGGGSCVPGSATCTIRQAIVEAKAIPGRDVVRIPPGTYALTGQDLIIAIGEQLDLVGQDPRTTVLQEVSGGDGRVLLVEQDASLHLRGLTLTGSRDAAAVLLFGGGNELRATDVVFTGNTAVRGAAVDATAGATVALDGVTIHGNAASDVAGAVRMSGGGTALDVRRSTVTGNSAPLGAGIVVATGTATIEQATVAGNAGGGADVATSPGATTLVRASVLGGCSGAPVTSQGANLEAGAACGLTGPGDRVGTDPLLGPLGDAGGPTPTRVPQAGSPLLDADASCPAGGVDQRGVARPQGPACDIGAVEVEVAPPPVPGPAPQVLPPAITALSLTPGRFRAGTGAGRGTRVRVRVTRAATLRLRAERARPGRRSGGRCVAPGRRRVPVARRCTRWVLVRGAVERTVPAGTTTVRFSGRLAGRTLRPGRYRLVVRARADGRSGPPARRPFAIRGG